MKRVDVKNKRYKVIKYDSCVLWDVYLLYCDSLDKYIIAIQSPEEETAIKVGETYFKEWAFLAYSVFNELRKCGNLMYSIEDLNDICL